MENATKALLIAAAVLIVILLIAFGMRIFNSTSDVGSRAETQAASTAVQAFNGQFSGFEGTISGTAIRNLQTAVAVSNQKNSSHQISISYTSPATATNIDPTLMYQVTLTLNQTTGYITGITVKKAS